MTRFKLKLYSRAFHIFNYSILTSIVIWLAYKANSKNELKSNDILLNLAEKTAYNSNLNSSCENKKQDDNIKIHISYMHQLDSRYEINNENFKFFMDFAYEPCSQKIDYHFILVIRSDNINLHERLKEVLGNDELFNQMTTCNNTSIRRRTNYPLGQDVCANAELLKSEKWKSAKKNYKYFFIINSTCRGPFLPVYWTEPWWKIFTVKFDQNPNLAGTGPYLSCDSHPHLQGFMMVYDKRGIEILENTWRCKFENETYRQYLTKTELEVGVRIYKAGLELEGLILSHRYKRTLEDYKLILDKNPFYMYPLYRKISSLFPGIHYGNLIKNCQCSDEYISKDRFAVNIHEVTWIKYHPKHTISNYIRKYVPVYTQIQYENKEFLKSKSQQVKAYTN